MSRRRMSTAKSNPDISKTLTMTQSENSQFAWLHTKSVEQLAAALGDDNLRFVGGAVRDSLLGREIQDLDAATSLPPEDVLARLAKAEIKAVPTGLKHGTVTAVFDDRAIEITTLRHDVETHGRHATVAFHSDWEADAARRDFTINALYVSLAGKLFDYYGGEDDLRQGRVRFIGDAKDRIREDALRIFRFFRIHAHYGKGEPDAEGLAACRELAQLAQNLSIERVRDEMLKLLAAADPVPLLQIMDGAGVLKATPFTATHFDRLEALVRIEEVAGSPSSLRRLFAFAADRDTAETLGKALRLSGVDTRRLTSMADAEGRVFPDMGRRALRAAVYRLGRQTVIDRLYLAVRPSGIAELIADLETVRSFVLPIFPVKGRDLQAQGVPEGEEMGERLAALEETWVASDFRLTRDELLELAEAKGDG